MIKPKLEDRTSIEYLRDTFKIGSEAFLESKAEAKLVRDMFHNRHYTAEQLNLLSVRGQPAETFNIIKLFSRLLLGYYSTLITKVVINPVGLEDVITASVLNDVVSYVFKDNNFIEEGEKIKLCGILSGLMCTYSDVQPTGTKDSFGRPINKIVLEYVPESEIVLDPMSKREDYKDARFIHRFKWLSEEAVLATFGKAKMDDMIAYYNITDDPHADYEANNDNQAQGYYRLHNNYLIIHSIVIDAKGDSWSIFWHNETILQKDKITHKKMKFPYRVIKTHTSEESEYYGIFRDVIESQKAINQALIKLQLLINTQRAFVEEGAIDNLADFTNSFNRVTAVIPVISLAGVRVDNQSREAQEQYIVIDKNLDRVQRVLGINDSFLGMAFASDSGRKVKLQQNASVIALRYFTGRVESFYRLVGGDVLDLIQQYLTSHQVLRITDEHTGFRWAEINKPATIWNGQMDEGGQPVMEYAYEEVLNPASGEPLIDEEGNYIIAPIPTEESEINFTNADVDIVSTSFNDEDEKNQLMLETVLSGQTGQLLAQINPAGFFEAAGLSMQSVKTKHSPEIAKIFNDTADMLKQSQQNQQQASAIAQGQPGQLGQQPKSETLKLP